MATNRYYQDESNTHCIHDRDTGALIFVHAIRESAVVTTVCEMLEKLNDTTKAGANGG